MTSQYSNGSIDVEAFIQKKKIERACDKDKHFPLYIHVYMYVCVCLLKALMQGTFVL